MSLPRRLLMTTDTVGGVWTYAIDLAEALAARHIACTLAVLGPAASPRQRAQADAIPGLELLQTGLPLDWLASDASDVLAAGQAVARLAKEVGADLVHLNTPALAASGAFTMPVLSVCHSCVRTWWACAGQGPMPAPFHWQSALVAEGYTASATLVAPTHAFAALTARCYTLAAPPHAVHNGRRARLAAASGPSGFVFTAGRLWDPGKNLATLDRAAARLPWPVMAAGPMQGPNGAQANVAHIEPLGTLDSAAMAQRLSMRPVFASLALYEPFGLAVLEAAQAGCALVLSDQAGFRELWDGAALFVPAGDDRAAAEAIALLMTDSGQRALLAARAAARAGAYTVDAMADAMTRLYAACLAPAGQAAAHA